MTEVIVLSLLPVDYTGTQRPTQNDEAFTIAQNVLRILDGAVDERDFLKKVTQKIEGRVQKRGSFIGDALPFSSQGFLYVVTATSLHVVLPPLAVTWSQPTLSLLGSQEQKWCAAVRLEGQQGWCKRRMSLKIQGTLTPHWQSEVLDRARVYDDLEEAELLCVENGWSLQLFHLRRLQLAVDIVQAEDVEHALDALVQVGAAESWVICVLFAAVELMLNQHGSDSELAQASQLLSSAAHFTAKLVRKLGLNGCQGYSKQYQRMPLDSSLGPSRYRSSSRTLRDLAL